jgi:hypothetical protein
MKNYYFAMKALSACLFFFIISTANVFSQVGIGTITPNSSAMLDVTSTTQGMLTPRMTTAQRIAIGAPADGLMVYDTDLKSFFHYNSSTLSWNGINSATTGRLKFKRIRSSDVLATVLAAELSAGGGSKYLLDSTTYYEINGTITFNFPIDLNNAYVSGQDTNDDILFKTSGILFDGANGGTVKNVTIAGGSSVFNLIATGNTQGFIFRDCIVSGSSNVGTISGFALVFFSFINYLGNASGITYSNSTRVLVSNTAWYGNNLGFYEKFTGSFSLLQKQGGFLEVNGSAIGVDVSANPTITGDAVMETVVFTGSNTTGYVNPYPLANRYEGYNFNNKWNVRCAGIPTESDAVSVGDINYNFAVGSGALTTLSGTPMKLSGTTTSNNLYRFSRGGTDNRLQYIGAKKRFFRISGSASFQSNANNTVYIFYVAKNGVVVNQSKVYVSSNSVSDILAVPIEAIVEMSANDFIEVYAERFSGSGNILTVSMNLAVN